MLMYCNLPLCETQVCVFVCRWWLWGELCLQRLYQLLSTHLYIWERVSGNQPALSGWLLLPWWYLIVFLISVELCWLTSKLTLNFAIFFPTGLILQNGTCIAVSQCPCVYHGTSYVQGHVLQQGCSVWWVWTCNQWWSYCSFVMCCYSNLPYVLF